MLCSNTCEELIYFRARSKLFLATAVVEKGREDKEKDEDAVQSAKNELKGLTGKELLNVIQYGIADLEKESSVHISENDLQVLFDDAKSHQVKKEKNDAIQPTLKKAKTFVRVKEQEEAIGIYNFEGHDYTKDILRENEDERALKELLEVGMKSRRKSVVVSPSRTETLLQRQQESVERKRAKLLELWEKNGYQSKKIDDKLYEGK